MDNIESGASSNNNLTDSNMPIASSVESSSFGVGGNSNNNSVKVSNSINSDIVHIMRGYNIAIEVLRNSGIKDIVKAIEYLDSNYKLIARYIENEELGW